MTSMKDITDYFSSSANNDKASGVRDRAKKEPPRIEPANVVLREKIKSKKKYVRICNVETDSNENSNDLKDDIFNKKKKNLQIENTMEPSDSSQLKRKVTEEATKNETRLGKRKKYSLSKSSKDSDESFEKDKSTSPKYDLNKSQQSSNFLKYFSKTIPEDVSQTKLTVESDSSSSPNLSSSMYNIFDIKSKNLSKNKDTSKHKRLTDSSSDQIYRVESASSSMKVKKPKSLDTAQMHSSLDSLDCESENIKKRNSDSLLDTNSSKYKSKRRKKLKIDNTQNFKVEKIKTNHNKSDKIDSDQSDAMRSVENNLNFNSQVTKKKSLEKESKIRIAPLFQKKTRINSDPVKSSVVNLECDTCENNCVEPVQELMPFASSMLPFPKVSHINQLPLQNYISHSICNLRFKSDENLKQSLDYVELKHVLNLDNKLHTSENVYECEKSNIEEALLEIEAYCADTPTLWKSISKLTMHKKPKQTLQRKTKSNKKNSNQSCPNNLQNDIFNSLWIDKYKPNSSADIVGNEEGAAKLKSWLSCWKLLKTNEDYSSSEEFYASDSSASNCIENNKVAVIFGPHGSGKTATVYAIANELDYKVLEVNASSRRTGRKITKDFEEATKSHNVDKLNSKNVFNTIKLETNKSISKNSLILMEDIDLVFDEDEGFISAIFHLASNTKRPIVITLSSNCSYLCKMVPHLRINFQFVTGERVLTLLQLITLAETGRKLSRNCLKALCQTGDLRKGILQLQYVLLSSKEQIPFTAIQTKNSSIRDIQSLIYKLAIVKNKISKSKDKKKKTLKNDKNLKNITLGTLVDYLDIFAIISVLVNIDDPTSIIHNLKFEPSLSLVENPSYYSSLDDISFEIGSWFSNAIKKKSNGLMKSSNRMDNKTLQLLIKRQINNSVNSILSQIPSITSDQQALALDYFSIIRTICRAEDIRNQLNSKRGKRFYHYLQSYKITIGKSVNPLSAVCKILQN